MNLLVPTPFPLPSSREQQQIVETVEDQLSVIDHLESDLNAKVKTTQGLRQTILKQAFTGKIVPQDPNDEPASELLKRIAAEREARAREIAAAKRGGEESHRRSNEPEASRQALQGEGRLIAENKQYEVALSFAGEQRGYVEKVARALQSRGIAVFYDDFEQVRLWGKDLVEELHEVFEHGAALAVIFISTKYVKKAWPRHEKRSSLSRAVQEKSEYVLPVRFDDTPVPGLPDSIKYERADDHTPQELASMIAEKLGIKPFAGKASDAPPPRMTSPTGGVVFDYSSHNGRYIIGRGQLEFETRWSKASDRSIHVLNDPKSINGVAVAKGCTSIAQVVNAELLDYTSRARTPKRGEIVVFRNVNGFYAAVHVLDIKDDSRTDDRDELRFRYAVQSNGSDGFAEFRDM